MLQTSCGPCAWQVTLMKLMSAIGDGGGDGDGGDSNNGNDDGADGDGSGW